MDVNNSTLLSQELREHILHLRRELTREDRSPLRERQRLSQRLTELLNQQPVIQVGVQNNFGHEELVDGTMPASEDVETELDQLRSALAIANDCTAGLEQELAKVRAELAALQVPGSETPEVIATLEIGDYQNNNSVYASLTKHIDIDVACADDRLMMVSQHERILAALTLGQKPRPDHKP